MRFSWPAPDSVTRTGGPEEVWQMCEDQRPGKLRLAGEVRGVPREHDAHEGREEGRQVARRDHAAVG